MNIYIHHISISSPVGQMTLHLQDHSVCVIWFVIPPWASFIHFHITCNLLVWVVTLYVPGTGIHLHQVTISGLKVNSSQVVLWSSISYTISQRASQVQELHGSQPVQSSVGRQGKSSLKNLNMREK